MNKFRLKIETIDESVEVLNNLEGIGEISVSTKNRIVNSNKTMARGRWAKYFSPSECLKFLEEVKEED